MNIAENGKSAKAANLAWRKKPRKFAPKSRLGCKTCKIRRIKCDLARPSCLKCNSTGRTCDGYGEPIMVCNNDSDDIESGYPFNDMSLRPFDILPVTGRAQIDALTFFQHVSIPHLSKYHSRDHPWHNTLMHFSQTVPSVRHAAIALALLHRSCLDEGVASTDLVSVDHVRPRAAERLHVEKTALFHYTRAIQLLLDQSLAGSTNDGIAIVLLVCYLFICFDNLAGSYTQAMKHLYGGVELLRTLKDSLQLDSDADAQIGSSDNHTFIRQVASRIRRLDMQAVMFLTDWTPATIQNANIMHLKSVSSTFWSIDQATDSLQALLARGMALYNEAHLYPESNTDSLSLQANFVLVELEDWLGLFENMLRLQQSSSSPHEGVPATSPLVALLHIQYTIATILLNSVRPDREMLYDLFLPQFEQCVVLAKSVMVAHEQFSSSMKPTFTPEMGILPALYIVGAKCRHPLVRREVVKILRRQLIREAVWNSRFTAKVLERIIDIEENGLDAKRLPIQTMDQITASQRIETVSWTHDVGRHSTDRLNVTYVFYQRTGEHTEAFEV